MRRAPQSILGYVPNSNDCTPGGLAPGHRLVLAGAAGMSAALILAVVGLRPQWALLPVALTAAGLLWWAVRYTTANPVWLAGALVLTDLATATWLLAGAQRALFHYGLIAAFCLPLLPSAWRTRSFARDGFRLYLYYFLWSAVTISYSLAPDFSTVRLLGALMAFGALSFVVSQIKQPQDVARLLTPIVLGCAVVVALVAGSAFLLPRSLTWVVPTDNDVASAGSVIRFCGIFNGPNDVGELMLVTVGGAAVLWPYATAKRRWLLALSILTALAAAALADSRTPFVALAVGAACYALWRHRGRAMVVLLLLAVLLAMAHLRPDSEGYLARGNVTTLTGRTDLWAFALSQIKQRPLLGYGYGVEGAILQSRYFPIWWGPWDMGPQSSLHDGYIARAVATGIPALLLWLFIVLRPWYAALRRGDDPWGLKPVAFWMVIPMLIHNLTEASISDCTGLIGVTFFLTWGIAERVRILRVEQERAERRKQSAALSPAAAALSAALMALALIAMARTARAQSNYHFPTLAPRAALPDDARCAVAASNGSSWEPRPAAATDNHTMPTFAELVDFHLTPIKGGFAPLADFLRVNGRFTGTTDQILRWGACKWGIDEDVVRAEALVQSNWHQEAAGDRGHQRTRCPPGSGFIGAWDGTGCGLSYGIMQAKFSSIGGWRLLRSSTAFNVDISLAYQRACMNGDLAYLAQQTPASGYPRYPHAGIDQMQWGCMGHWYSGSWYDPGALNYIAAVKVALAQRTWTKPGF